MSTKEEYVIIRLKRTIRDKARDICLYVTLGELLNELRRLRRFTTRHKTRVACFHH